jgi:hypothetical protein
VESSSCANERMFTRFRMKMRKMPGGSAAEFA